MIGARGLRRAFGVALASAVLWAALLPGLAMAWPKQAGPFLLVHGPRTARVVDAGSGALGPVVAASPAGYFSDVALSYDGRYMLLVEAVGDQSADFLTLVDVATNAVTRRIALADAGLGHVAVAPDGRTVYVVGLQKLSVVDLATMQVVRDVPLAATPQGLAVSPSGAVYLYDYNQIYAFDAASKMVKTVFHVDRTISGLAFSPDGKFAYLNTLSAPNVARIDLASMSVVKTGLSVLATDGVVVHPDGSRLYVRNLRPYVGVSVLDAASLSVLATVRAADDYAYGGIAISPDGGKVFVSRIAPFLADEIDTARNVRAARFALADMDDYGVNPLAAALPSPGLPFAQIGVALLDVAYATDPTKGSFNYYAYVTLNAASNGLRPDLEGLSLNVGGLEASVPPGRFVKQADGSYVYNAWVNGVLYNSYVRPAGADAYLLHLLQYGVTLPDIANPVQLRQRVGDDGGVQSVIATITRPVAAAP